MEGEGSRQLTGRQGSQSQQTCFVRQTNETLWIVVFASTAEVAMYNNVYVDVEQILKYPKTQVLTSINAAFGLN